MYLISYTLSTYFYGKLKVNFIKNSEKVHGPKLKSTMSTIQCRIVWRRI